MQTLRDQIVGAWRLESYTARNAEGQVRRARLEGDILTLSPAYQPGSEVHTIVWRRAPLNV